MNRGAAFGSLGALGVALGVALGAGAQVPGGIVSGASGIASDVGRHASVRDRFGVERGKQMLSGATMAERLSGIERLGLDGSDDAIKALVGALESGNSIRSSPRARLEAARALAPYALGEDARRGLELILGDTVEEGVDAAMAELARDTATLALARAAAGLVRRPEEKPAAKKSSERDSEKDDAEVEEPKTPEELAVTPVLAAVISAGSSARFAAHALALHPPANLWAFLRGSVKMPLAEIDLLGALGDARALPMLRRQLQRKNRQAQMVAAIGLSKLADQTLLPVVRAWLKDAKTEPYQKAAAVEVLMRLGAPEAATELSKLLAAAATRPAGFALAEQWISPLLVPTLTAIVGAPVLPAEKRRAAVLLARSGSEKAVAPLTKLLADADLAQTAIFGIAGIPGPEAADALDRALGSADGAARRMVLRAALVRDSKLGERLPGLADACEKAFASKEPADRALGAFGLAWLGRRSIRELGASATEEVVFAAAAAAASLGPTAAAELAPLVAKAAAAGEGASAALLAASAPALFAVPDAASATDLARWAEAGGPNAPLAAYRLAARDPASFRPRLRALFGGTDTRIRIHLALGLGLSPEPDAVSLLASAYRGEADAEVRRALIRALSLRHERRREAALRLAAELDPDDEARSLAAAALRGRRHALALAPARGEVGWLALVANDAASADTIRARPVWAIRADGLALPLASPPDGVVLLLGQPRYGEIHFRVLPHD